MKRSNPFVERVLSKGDRFVFDAAQVAVHRLPDHGRDTYAAPLSGITQLAPGLLRKSQVRDDVARHSGITISRYRDIANVASEDLTPLFLESPASSSRESKKEIHQWKERR